MYVSVIHHPNMHFCVTIYFLKGYLNTGKYILNDVCLRRVLLHFCVRMFLKGHLNIQENTSSMTYVLAPTNSLLCSKGLF